MNVYTEVFKSSRYHIIMLASIYLYALLNISIPSIGGAFKTIIILGSLGIFYVHRKSIFKEPIVLLLFATLILQGASWYNSTIQIPELANNAPKIDRLAKLFLFFLMAYWLKGSIKNTFILWTCYIVGFFISLYTHSYNFFHELNLGLTGVRVDFHIKNAQYTSMFSGVSLLISILLFHSIALKNKFLLNNNVRLLFSVFAIASILFFLIMVIITQSRMVWLGIIVSLFLFPLAKYITYKNTNFKVIIASYLVIITLSLVTLGTSLSHFKSRSVGDTETIYKVLNFDFQNIPMSSAGIRINSWVEASKWVVRNPILGVDSEGPGLVIKQSKMFQDRYLENEITIKSLRHLHNFHIEVLVSYGLIGLIIIYILYLYIPYSIVKLKDNKLQEFALFSLLFVSYWLCINFFESFNSRSYGVFTHNIILAGLYTFVLNRHLKRNECT